MTIGGGRIWQTETMQIMKTKLCALTFLLAAAFAPAQTNSLTALLQQGLLEEQANRNLDAAIADYQSLAAQFDKDRQLAATAVFRLGECYRAQGKTNEAAAQYQRILREFPDQQTLATMSRQNLTGLRATAPEAAPSEKNDVITDEDKEIQRIRQLIQDSPDLINTTADGSEDPPLIHAAKSDQLRVAQYLLDSNANVNVKNGAGDTPLTWAASQGHKAMVELLLSRGAEVNAKGGNGDTALHRAALHGFQAVVGALLADHADVNALNSGGETPLFLAAQDGRTRIVQMLLTAGAKVNVEANNGRTPLSYAAERGSPETVKMLLAAKADPNGGKLDVPLLCAIHKEDAKSAELLLQNGAAPNVKEMVDWPVVINRTSYGSGRGLSPASVTPLWAAVLANQLPMVNLLLKFKADPNDSQTDGRPLLFTALALSNRDILEALLDYHADPNVRNNDGQTPLNCVNTSEDKKTAGGIADLLRQHGALDNPPNWDLITISRPSANFSHTIFTAGTNDWNRFGLLETILNFYEYSQQHSYNANGLWTTQSAASATPFPDLARIVIVRPSHGSTNQTRIAVNLLNSANGIDCSKDVPLEFGDVVEIPERGHSLGDSPVGLTSSQCDSLVNYLKGNVQLVVRDQKVELPLNPVGDQSIIGTVLGRSEARNIILSSSDLSRVKVSRHDPKTGNMREWILDCSNPQSRANGLPRPGMPGALQYQWAPSPFGPAPNQPPPSPDLRLRDGDVIEVPEKL